MGRAVHADAKAAYDYILGRVVLNDDDNEAIESDASTSGSDGHESD